MSADIFLPWSNDVASGWNRRPMRLTHRLHEQPALQTKALADLVQRYPRNSYALVMTSRPGDPRTLWREGDIAGVSGQQTRRRLGEVRQAYRSSFGGIWPVPFLLRYGQKILSRFEPAPSRP